MFNRYVDWWHQLDHTEIYIVYIYFNKVVVTDKVDNIMILHLLYEEMCISTMLCRSLCNVLHSCFGQRSLQTVCFLCAHVYRQFTGEYR